MSTNMELIETKTVGSGGSATIVFTSIPQTYTDLKLVVSARGNTGQMTFNGTGGTAYSFRRLMGVGSGTPSSGANSGISQFEGFDWNYTTYTANTFSSTEIYIPNYTSSNFKSISLDTVQENNATQAYAQLYAGLFSNTSPITSITLTSSGGNFVEGSTAYLYGISSVTSTPKATGGIVSQDATHWYHTFPFSSTFTPTEAITCDYLVIGGGGGGGGFNGNYGGGGGAGGLRSTVSATGGGGTLESALSLTAQAYAITVGAGGAATLIPTSGSNSVFSTITSNGGGRGGSSPDGSTAQAASGGSGGGGDGYTSTSGASGTTNQGRAGGNGHIPGGGTRSGGGGGGANTAGTNASASRGGKGGDGVLIPAMANATFTGVGTYFAGGGGGSSQSGGGTEGLGGLGGLGGGGNGTVDKNAQAGVANTGSGGGAAGYNNDINVAGNPGNGGSGVVIVRYAK